MRIEFYIKTTGESVRYQDEYVIDGLNDIYELWFTGNGEYELKRPLSDIGIRFITSTNEN